MQYQCEVQLFLGKYRRALAMQWIELEGFAAHNFMALTLMIIVNTTERAANKFCGPYQAEEKQAHLALVNFSFF